MAWGIAETAPEKEKIKSQFSDYLGGLNSVGEISYSTYSQAWDISMDLLDKMYEQGFTDCKSTISKAGENLDG